jgi:hypothetical protein
MKRWAFAIGLLALGFSAATPANADYAVVKWKSGYCRVWTDTKAGPEDGQYLRFRYHWRHHYGWRYRFLTAEGADKAMHRAVGWKRCTHWW